MASYENMFARIYLPNNRDLVFYKLTSLYYERAALLIDKNLYKLNGT